MSSSIIKTVGVCGAGGTMGAGIAIVAARAGFRTISFDRSGDALGDLPPAVEHRLGVDDGGDRLAEPAGVVRGGVGISAISHGGPPP